jgi:hypothetical protein
MKKIKLLLLLFISVQMVAFGQNKLSKDFEVTLGTPYPVVDALRKDYFSDDKGHAISIKTQGETVTLQRFDVGSMKELSRKVYNDLPPYNKFQKALKIGDRLFYIFSSFNKKERKEDLYSREVNMADGTFASPKLLFSTASEVAVSSYTEASRFTMLGGMIPIRFEVYKSFDNSKMLIRYRLNPVDRDDSKNYDVLGFYVFNANLDKLWGGEVKMPYTEKQMNNIAYGVSKDGNAFMLAHINDSKQFELLNITSDLNVKANKIDIDGSLAFQELKLQEVADGNLTCIGYYANGIDFSVNWIGRGSLTFNTNGILNFKMDQNGKVLEQYNYEFPLELINQYESRRVKEKNSEREGDGNAGIGDLKMINVTFGTDGSTTIIGEQQYIRREFVRTSQKTVWYYGDVVASKFDKQGTLLWIKKLPKTQIGFQGKGGLSVRYIMGAGANYVLYLDNIRNAALSLEEVPEKHEDGKGGYLTAYKINEATGAIEKHSIFDITNIKGTEAHQFSTYRIFDVQDNVFLLETYIKGKKDTMIKMSLTK